MVFWRSCDPKRPKRDGTASDALLCASAEDASFDGSTWSQIMSGQSIQKCYTNAIPNHALKFGQVWVDLANTRWYSQRCFTLCISWRCILWWVIPNKVRIKHIFRSSILTQFLIMVLKVGHLRLSILPIWVIVWATPWLSPMGKDAKATFSHILLLREDVGSFWDSFTLKLKEKTVFCEKNSACKIEGMVHQSEWT